MYQSKLQQYRYDIEMWKRALRNAQEENTILKNRLADLSCIIQEKKDIDLLDLHQTSLIKIDNIFSIFRNDIYRYNLMIEEESSAAGEATELIISRHSKMSNEIELIESTFNNSKFNFTKFCIEVILKGDTSN